MASGLEAGFLLDRQWHWLRGEMEQSKRPALLTLARVLTDEHAPYAIIGGIALQVHQTEPRTTLDIDVAVPSILGLPRAALEAQGFKRTGGFTHSDNWIAPDGTPVQFTDDPALHQAISRAQDTPLAGVTLRVITLSDLFHEKLRACADPARRRSKRLQDLADAHALLEATPSLADELTRQERAVLETWPG